MNKMRNPILSTDNTGNTGYTGKSKTKKVILIIIIVLIVLILLGGGIFAYTYFFTDLFLSEKQGFYKYIAKNSELLEIFKDEDLSKYLEKIQNEAYSNDGEFSISLTGDIDEETKKITDEIQKHKITLKSNVDNSSKYSSQELKLKYGEKDVISGVFINKDDYLGLKVNDIGLNKFITLENNNLKQFAKNLGLTDEQIESIPDKIDFENLQRQEIFSKEELIEIKDRYLKVITDNLTEDMFSKKEENGESVYTLTVTEESGKVIFIALIDTLKNDEELLNKMKQVYIEQMNATEEEAQSLIDNLKNSLEEAKNDLNGSSSNVSNEWQLEQQETQSENLYINVYVSNRKLTKTEIFIENEGKLILTNSENKISLGVAAPKEETNSVDLSNTNVNEYNENQTAEKTYKTVGSISIEKNKTDNELSYKFTIMEEQNRELVKAILTYTGLVEMTNIDSSLMVDIDLSDLINGDNSILSQAQSAKNNTMNAQEEEKVKLAILQLINDIYADTYTSNNEVVMNETTIKETLNQEGLNVTVSRNEDGTYRILSNITGNIYTVNSQGNVTNTEFAETVENSVENTEKTINISLSLKGNTTFGAIGQQELTESDMYIINNKSLEQLQSLFNQLGERTMNKIATAYQNSIIGQMITQ